MSTTTQCATHEPLAFAVGDTLIFTRYFTNFLPSNGWSLLYEIRQHASAPGPVQFTSTADPTGTFHQINVPSATTAAWLSGTMVLVGYAVNTSGERHEIYFGALNLFPNLGTNVDNVPVQTHAQKMIASIEAQLETLANHALQDSNIQQVELRRVQRMELEKQLAWNKQLRANEVALENVRNGRPSGERIRPQTKIVNTGWPYASGQTWPFQG